MAYRAYLQNQCLHLTIDQTLGHCHALLQNGFEDYDAAGQTCAEMVEAVHWFLDEQESQGIIPASDTQKVWLSIEETHGRQKVNECLHTGCSLAKRSESICKSIQAQWPRGAYGVIGPQYHPGSLSLEVLKLLAEASEVLAFDVAKRDLEAIVRHRLSKADNYAQRMLPGDVRKLLDMYRPKKFENDTSQAFFLRIKLSMIVVPKCKKCHRVPLKETKERQTRCRTSWILQILSSVQYQDQRTQR